MKPLGWSDLLVFSLVLVFAAAAIMCTDAIFAGEFLRFDCLKNILK